MCTYTVVAELSHHVLLLMLAYVDHIVACIDAIPIVVKGNLPCLSRYIATFQILKESFACSRRGKRINSRLD